MTPREVIPDHIPEDAEREVYAALTQMVEDEKRHDARNQPSPWRSMETAPENGTLFLAYMGQGNMEIARYDLERKEWWVDAYAPPHIEKSWMEAWMPLPEPPRDL
jgi:hypothetical protein